jgi:aminoglycoside phosphotransferase family enzyme/predicted kinase
MTADVRTIEGQQDIAGFLADPATHGGIAVERIDTHVSMVFLVGDRVYKVKRAVRFSYLDFSTPEKREAACRAEVTLNRRTARELYRGVVAITRGADGRLALGGGGEPVEWAVVMRRFAQDGLFDRLAERGELTADRVRDAVTAAAALHRDAEVLPTPPGGDDGAAGLRTVVGSIATELADYPELFGQTETAEFVEALHAALDKVSPLLERRLADGMLRRCHGDLHLRNICLVDGKATLFDCIEFNESIACIDVLHDIAFLLMDLEHRGLEPLANVALNTWLPLAPGGASATLEGLAALPLMLAMRAGVRAMVSASAEAAQGEVANRAAMHGAARSYFMLARAFLDPLPACLIAVGGLSGSGKSTLARRLAPMIGRPPGAVHLRSDAIRKELWGTGEAERLPQEAYARAISDRVYAELFARARLALAAGQAAIVDAVNADPEGRGELRRLAERSGVPFAGFWLDAPSATLLQRVIARRGDASDADAAVVLQQLEEDVGEIDWHRLDAGAGADTVVEQAWRILEAA